jgi:hypothetical protein
VLGLRPSRSCFSKPYQQHRLTLSRSLASQCTRAARKFCSRRHTNARLLEYFWGALDSRDFSRAAIKTLQRRLSSWILARC